MKGIQPVKIVEGVIEFEFDLIRDLDVKGALEFGKAAVTRFNDDVAIEPEMAYFSKANVNFRDVADAVLKFQNNGYADARIGFTSGPDVEYSHTISLYRGTEGKEDTVFFNWRAVYHGPDFA